jgi:hypothetical protein
MPGIKADVKLKGPIANGRGRPMIVQARTGMVRELIEMGESHLADMLRPRPKGVYLSVAQAGKKASKGHYRRNLTSKITRTGGVITDGGVVYGPWLEGISSRNSSTRFKGYGAFRQTKSWLNEKAKGVAKNHLARAVRRMG